MIDACTVISGSVRNIARELVHRIKATAPQMRINHNEPEKQIAPLFNYSYCARASQYHKNLFFFYFI
jgi:hypothetical protein